MAFRSVFVDAKISNPATGKVAHLKLINEGQTIPYLESVSIDLEAGANMNMSINLAPPYREALELLSKNNEWLRLGNTLGVRWGYADIPGALSDWYYGFMGMPQPSFGDEISISIPATTLAWNADRVERTRDWCSAFPKSYKDIATNIAKRYGLKPEFGDLSARVKRMLELPRQSFVQGGRTDLQFLLEEGERFGLRVISLNDILYFVDSAAPLPGYPKVNATFQMYGKIDIWNNIFSMNSFSSETMGTLFIKQFQGTNALAYGPNDDPTVEKDPRVATDATSEVAAFTSKDTVSNPSEEDGRPPKDMGGIQTKATVKVNPEDGEGGKMFCLPLNGDETPDFVDSFLSGVREGSAEEHGLSVEFSSPFAVPNLLPRMFVDLGGVGDYFNGTYMLKKLGLNIDANGAEMDCEGFGRGFPGVDRQIDPFASEATTYIEPVKDTWIDSLFTKVKEPVE